MNLQQLRYAVEVERTGSITQAAENLFMGQPNLSKAIRELEREVGIEIFLRTPRGMELTEKGRVFLGYAKQILAQVRQMEELGQGESPIPGGFPYPPPAAFISPMPVPPGSPSWKMTRSWICATRRQMQPGQRRH